jgi:hypothetical protein
MAVTLSYLLLNQLFMSSTILAAMIKLKVSKDLGVWRKLRSGVEDKPGSLDPACSCDLVIVRGVA